jgi:hypothetical protein|tara:strand:+ start:219 stop:398 length:180 start_codon:yes stop_codon:yes gene_type:complete
MINIILNVMDKKYAGWEMSTGIFPGIVFGIRTYEDGDYQIDHVLYLGFIDICLSLYYEE